MFFLFHILETYNNVGVRRGAFDWDTALQEGR